MSSISLNCQSDVSRRDSIFLNNETLSGKISQKPQLEQSTRIHARDSILRTLDRLIKKPFSYTFGISSILDKRESPTFFFRLHTHTTYDRVEYEINNLRPI